MTKAEAQDINCPEMKAMRRQSFAANRRLQQKAREILGKDWRGVEPTVLPYWPPKAPPYVQTDLDAGWVRRLKRDAHKATMLRYDANTRSVIVRDIIIAVSRERLIGVKDIISHRRARHLVDARQLVCYLARRLTGLSLPQIGKKLGNRDHSTIHHAVAVVDKRVKADPDFRMAVEDMTYAVLVQAEDRQSY